MPKCCCAGSKAAPSSGFGRSACCRRRRADRGQSIRNMPVLGGIDDVEDVIRDFARRGKPISRRRHDAVGVRARGASRSRPDAARKRLGPDRQPPAVAGKRRRAEADQRRRRGPAAAAERKDRLRASRSAGEGQGGHRHRRRRLDRFGDLRPRRDLRRRAVAGDREFGAGALRGDGGAGRARHRRCRSRAALPTSAIANGSCA